MTALPQGATRPLEAGPGVEIGSPLAEVEAAIGSLHPLLHDLELKVAALGIPVAPLYIASARGSLRHVSACIGHFATRPRAVADHGEVILGSGIGFAADARRSGLGIRTRFRGRSTMPALGAELPSWAAMSDLGADLFGSPEARSLCEGPIGATLLFCALAHHQWLHIASGAKWSTDRSGARALVAALNSGAGCTMPAVGLMTRLVDVEVVDMLAAMGWARLISPRMPGHVYS